MLNPERTLVAGVAGVPLRALLPDLVLEPLRTLLEGVP